jgi:hypothetical protein
MHVVWPVAIHTRKADGMGIIAAVHRPVLQPPPSASPDQPRPRGCPTYASLAAQARQAGWGLEPARGLAGIKRKQQGDEKQQSHDWHSKHLGEPWPMRSM